MKKSIALLTAVVLALALTACGTSAPPVSEPPTPSPAPTATPEPGPEITPELLARLRARIDGSTATMPLTEALYADVSDVYGYPKHNTTSQAYRNLIDSKADLIFVTPPSEDELQLSADTGIELEVIPVVKDALIFMVNADNPVDNITSAQLRDIYAGKITNWSELGGLDEDIIPYQREANSGSQTLFLKLLMDGLEPMKPPSHWVIFAMGGLVEAVSDYDNARGSLGYSMFYYVNNMYGNSRFKLLSVDGVKPARDTIMSGEYAFDDAYYAVIRSDTPEDARERQMIDWLLTDEGQALAVKAGYIPLRPIEGAEPESDIDPVYLGDTENSSGTGGTVLIPAEEATDMLNGNVRKPLSDMFFDGFNYIGYINDEIARQLQSQVRLEIGLGLSAEDYLSRRPFSGIPNDYPHYELAGGYLRILFPRDNPFFDPDAWVWNFAMDFRVPLRTDISPYGSPQNGFTCIYDRVLTPSPNLSLLLPQFTLFHSPPGVFEHINETLAAWADSLMDDKAVRDMLEEYERVFVSSYDYNHEMSARSGNPSIGQWRDYLTVNYSIYATELSNSGVITGSFSEMLANFCFDINTGEAVRLADKLPNQPDYAKANIYAGWGGGWFDYMEDYIPAAGSVVTDAWVSGLTVSVIVTEPDGRSLLAEFRNGIE